jgi:hypothetical protein
MSDRVEQAHTAAPRSPGPEIQRLGTLVGRWRSEGHIVGDTPVPITGTDVYEWLPGGFFLVHHVDVVIGEEPVRAIEIIGEHDPATDAILGRAYDNLGNMSILRVDVDDRGVWTFTGGGDVAPVARPSTADEGGAVRSTLTVSPDGSGMVAEWERSDDGSTWERWMDMTFTQM